MKSVKRVNLELDATISFFEKSQIRRKPESSRSTIENTNQTLHLNGLSLSNTKQFELVPQNKEDCAMLVDQRNMK